MQFNRGGMQGYGGGRPGLSFGPGFNLPPMVKGLLIANISIFVLLSLLGISSSISRQFGMIPREVFAEFKLYQLVTYMFIHGGFRHVLVNMFMLWMFGSAVERAWGSRDFLSYYFVCGIGGAIASWATGPGSEIPVIGASGAVLGLLLAYGMMYPNREILIYFLFPIKMKYFIWIMVAIDLFSGLGSSGDGVAHFAHLGGMLAGWLYLKQDWRAGSMTKKFRAARARQEMARNTKREEARQVELEKIDDILDKINREGMASLTDREKKILNDATKH